MAATFMVAALLVGCGGGATAPSQVPQGIWTSSLARVEVAGGQVTFFELRHVSCGAVSADPSCARTLPVQITKADAAIEQGNFHIERSFLEVSGGFSSDRASGTFTFHHPDGCCDLDGTWYALPPAGSTPCVAENQTPGQGAALEVGLSDPDGTNFDLLGAGTDVEVVMGFQGFKMIVLAVREKSLPLTGQVVTLRLTGRDNHVLLGDLDLRRPAFSSGPDGSMLLPDLALVVTANEGDFVDQPAMLEVSATNECGLSYSSEPIEVQVRKRY